MHSRKYTYCLICEKTSLNDKDTVQTYGLLLRVQTVLGSFTEKKICDISTHKEFVEYIRQRLNQYQAEHIHFPCLIEDFLAQEWDWLQEKSDQK